jgi:hypothetical protein
LFGEGVIAPTKLHFAEYEGTVICCPHITTLLIFARGNLFLEEKHTINNKKSKRVRLHNIRIDNDNELDIILRQTYPLWELKPFKSED